MSLIEVRNLKYVFEQLVSIELETKSQEIIHDLSFKIEPHEFIGLAGPNGSGKTTISKLLTQIIEPSAGYILFHGVNYKDLNPQWRLHQKVSLVFQNAESQFIAPNFLEDVRLYLSSVGLNADQIEKRVDEVGEKMGIAALFKRPFKTLSGGQKQLLAIAEAMAVRPELLILDEPTAQLDPENSLLVFNFLKELKQDQKISILLISHKASELALTDKVLLLKNGTLTQTIQTNDLLINPELLEENQLPIPKAVDLARRLSSLLGKQIILEEPTINNLIKKIEDANDNN